MNIQRGLRFKRTTKLSASCTFVSFSRTILAVENGMVIEEVGLYLDYSKNRITGETLDLLRQLADECDLRGRIDAMFRGDQINVTEKRPACISRSCASNRVHSCQWTERRP